MGDLLGCHLRLAPKLHAGAGPLGNHAALKLGQDTDHLPHGAARGRFRVDVLGEGLELDAARAQIVQHGDQVAQAAAQPVQFPNDEGIAWLKRLETAEQGRALCRRP